MRKAAIILFIFVAGITYATAQRIYFCDNYTQSGEPIGSNTLRSCPPEGGFVYILFQNGADLIREDRLYLSVDKLSGDNYIPFDVKEVYPDKSKSWLVYDYNFINTGDYRVTVKNAQSKELAKDFIKLVPVENKSTTSSTGGIDYDDPSSMFYYTYSTVIAAVGVSETGFVTTQSTSFSIDRTLGGRIKFKVSNAGKALQTDRLIVYIDKKDASGNYVAQETKYFDVTNKYLDWTSFYIDFFASGDYNITVYSGSMVFINTVSINLSYKS